MILPAGAQYTFFSDDFESIPVAQPDGDPTPLLNNGMFVGANVFDETNTYIYNYFGNPPFPAPNITGDGARFTNIAESEGGPEQGNRVLSVFSDYNNAGAHTAGGETSPGSGVYTGGDLIDAIVFVEYFIDAADLGTTLTFKFDAKFGNFQTGPVLGSTPPFDAEAEVFLKVLDPSAGFSTLGQDVMDATAFSATWSNDNTLTLLIDPSWENKLIQAGFRTKTSNYAPSAIFYDNVSLTSDRVDVVDPAPQILSTSWDSGEFRVDFFGRDGFEYTLWKAASIEGPYDIEIDFIDGQDALEYLSDMEASGPNGFYRLEEQPIPE